MRGAVLALLIAAPAGCSRGEAQAPAAPVDAGARLRCGEDLPRLLAEVERVPTPRRAGPALAALGRGCAEPLGDLAPLAVEAAALDRDARSRLLGKAGLGSAGPSCRVDDFTAPALPLSRRCTAPGLAQVSPGLIRHLQAGTWVFLVAARTRLDDAGAMDDRAHRLFQHLLLGLGLEGEARRAMIRTM